MGIGKVFKSFFGNSPSDSNDSSSQAVVETLEYSGLTIEAAPIREGSQYRTAGFISGDLEGETYRVPFIRADNNSDQQAAVDHSLSKGRQIIDEQGKTVLKRSHL